MIHIKRQVKARGLGIRGQLGLGFAALLVLLGVVGYIGWRNTSQFSQAFRDLYDYRLVPSVELGKTTKALYELRLGGSGQAYAVGNAEAREKIKRKDAIWLKTIETNIKAFGDIARLPEEKELLANWASIFPQYLALRERVIALVDAGRRQESAILRTGQTSDYMRQCADLLDRMAQLEESVAQTRNNEVSESAATSLKLLVMMTLFALIFAAVVAVYLSQRIGKSLSIVAGAAHGIAGGDLRQKIPITSSDEVGQVASAFRVMIENLRRMTTELQHGSSALTAASSQILLASTQVSTGGMAQSTALQEATTTVDEVRASAQQTVQMAEVVSTTAQEAHSVAGAGVKAARDAIQGMNMVRDTVEAIADDIMALAERSEQIGEIIASVNELAEQLNRLALNATIEASRAGEQGRGFRVVATEMRSLAEQSKGATIQVRTILSEIQRATSAAVMATEEGTQHVAVGSQLVDEAGQTITRLEEVIKQSANSARQIAASIRQHSTGMEQISVAMTQINQATTHNLAASDDTKVAAENVTTLAERLDKLVSQYRL